MRPRSLLAILLFLHVLAHPAVHDLPSLGPASPQIEQRPDSDEPSVVPGSLGPCLGCRTASSLLAAPVGVASVPVTSHWEKLSVSTDSHRSLPPSTNRPARAPPLS